MARKATSAANTDASNPAPKNDSAQGSRKGNPRRGRKGRRHRRRNPKKNLGYGAKVGIAIGALVVVGGGGYMLYRHFKKPAGCPPGMKPNPKIDTVREGLLSTGLPPDTVELTVAKLPECVPI